MRPALASMLAVAALSGPLAQFRTAVAVVDVYVSVADARGEPIEGLEAGDFEVLEDGRPQEVAVFTAGNFGLAVALAVDRSFSIGATRLNRAKSAARRFIDALRPEDMAMIVAVGSRVETTAPLSTARAEQRAAIDALDPFGSTSLHDAIIAAVDSVQHAPGRRALVLLSDGVDRYSQAAASDVVAHARGRDVLIFPIAVGTRRPPLFVDLAAVTGGRSIEVRDAGRLEPALLSVARELRQQYLLGYVPSRPIATDREWRSIVVRVKTPGAAVRHRQGYWTR